MTSKIDSCNPAVAGAALSKPAVTAFAGKTGSAAQGKVVAIGAGDTVKLTDDSQQLHDLEKTIAALPVVDRVRVQQTRQAIQSGSYSIDPQSIAIKLMHMEWSLRT